MREARALLRLAHDMVAGRLEDEIGISERKLFSMVQKAIDEWFVDAEYLDLTVEIDYEVNWYGKFYRETRTSPAEYPEPEVEIAKTEVKMGVSSLDIRELVELVADNNRSPDLWDAILGSKRAMRVVKTAINRFDTNDIVDVPVEANGNVVYETKKGDLVVSTKLQGRRVVFKVSGFDADNLVEEMMEKALEEGLPERDDYDEDDRRGRW